MTGIFVKLDMTGCNAPCHLSDAEHAATGGKGVCKELHGDKNIPGY